MIRRMSDLLSLSHGIFYSELVLALWDSAKNMGVRGRGEAQGKVGKKQELGRSGDRER